MNSFPINPDVYTNTSLEQDIERACDSQNPLTLQQIANIVVKYLFSYFYFRTKDQIPLVEILELIQALEKEEVKQLTKEEIREAFEVSKLEVATRFQMERFACQMLLDIPATVEIFRDIALRVIDPSISREKYIGIDFGSGSGILTLAQYIQAKRNSFQEIQNYGLEIGSMTSVMS